MAIKDQRKINVIARNVSDEATSQKRYRSGEIASPSARNDKIVRLPQWLRKDVLLNFSSRKVHSLIKELSLNTVCQSARCPNRNECFSGGTATFMILGNTCTRGCTFCSVPKGKPVGAIHDLPLRNEPENVANAVKM